MMEGNLLNWYQALQLMALGPCLFIIFFLLVTARNFSKIIVPVLYFVALACSFILPLGDTLGFGPWLQQALVTGKSTMTAFSFLLIITFITGDIPALVYWAVLTIPLVGGSSIDYATTFYSGSEICIHDNLCAAPFVFRQLYEVFSAGMIFLLTIALYNRLGRAEETNSYQARDRYAIIVSLIVLNLIILAMKLAQASGHLDLQRAEIAGTVVRMGFIYLVLTYIFRVFDRSFEIAYERVPTIAETIVDSTITTEKDKALAKDVTQIMESQKLYRQMDLSREMLAKKLAVTENNLSRAINKCFSQNFSMLVNGYRVEEAKQRLADETTPITTIAFEVGFNSIPSFNRVFKQITGVSPSEYRSQNNNAVS
ncbi:MAG TPA: helix-turn-helix domain-containing protein [Rickettsiales bacterium]|nr:helix-turn-helix domain-containing protein [Rickettsiales bacterium]